MFRQATLRRPRSAWAWRVPRPCPPYKRVKKSPIRSFPRKRESSHFGKCLKSWVPASAGKSGGNASFSFGRFLHKLYTCGIALLLAAAPARADGVADFYRGKTINVL